MKGPAVFLAIADLVAFLAMLSIVWRLAFEYQQGALTTKKLLTGGLLFAALLGLLAAGVQTLVSGPSL